MIIDQVVLCNFRVYYGTNILTLSKEQDRHITIVAGNNGFGKTSFLTGLVWGLYGKLMADVDPRYRSEINESGGYKKYCDKLMNRLALSDVTRISKVKDLSNLQEENIVNKLHNQHTDNSFSITLLFSHLNIPSVKCENVQIKRTYFVNNHVETVEILIDGKVNELTKGVGPEIFINDFILPREIAKFFFFDAEKIVALSEIKSIEERRFLSQAYSEVLGIKKYTDLKSNLENVRMRLRSKSSDKELKSKFSKLQNDLIKTEKVLALHSGEILEKKDILVQKRIISDKYQEQLIREGSGMTLDQIKKLRESLSELSVELIKNRVLFNELLDLAPFAIASVNLNAVKVQLELELNSSPLSYKLLSQRVNSLNERIKSSQILNGIGSAQTNHLIKIITDTLLPKREDNVKMIFNFTPFQQSGFFAIYDNLKNSFSKNFRKLISEQKRIQASHNLVKKKLFDAESKEKDSVVNLIRQKKNEVDNEIKMTENSLANLNAKVSTLQSDCHILSRQISEVAKYVKIEINDQEVDFVAETTLDILNKFIFKLKIQKKTSLEKNILVELNRLMHKNNFVTKVEVNIDGELIDIELFDQDSILMDKDILSKGEQQLYATALLAALVHESNIHFPVFIDSPLQKFDKYHSENIIKGFYPNIADQVVLFPLLNKELNEEEYEWLLPLVGKSYMLSQSSKYQTNFNEVLPIDLFNTFNLSADNAQ